jgi:hypothetical protein
LPPPACILFFSVYFLQMIFDLATLAGRVSVDAHTMSVVLLSPGSPGLQPAGPASPSSTMEST